MTARRLQGRQWFLRSEPAIIPRRRGVRFIHSARERVAPVEPGFGVLGAMSSSINDVVRRVSLAVFVVLIPAAARSGDASAVGRLHAFLEANGSPQPLCASARGAALWSIAQAFYEARAFRPAWTEADGRTSAGQALAAALEAADRDGLDPARYEMARLLGRAETGTIPEIADVGLTVAFLRYASDLAGGRLGRVSLPFWRSTGRQIDLAALLAEAVESGSPDRALARARPAHPQYAALQEALARYRFLASREKAPILPVSLRLRPGQRSPHVAALRARLALEGDLEPSAPARSSDVFDHAMSEALKRYEARHGLAADGIPDAQVVAALNVPLAFRVAQLELNLERWRWLAPPTGPRAVLVNIPTFELHAYDNGQEALAMRVITGNPDSPTPVFSQSMTAVVFRPYWNVPPTILINETLPAARRDPQYLRRMGIEVVRADGRAVEWSHDVTNVSFRQRPGAGNALGLVKFLLPNPFSVYLHDTPSDGLFARAERALSHGCVRLDKPEEMARWVLAGVRGWTPERIRAAMRSGGQQMVPLPEAIPVSIVYFTAWVDASGTVQLRPDVYGHDAVQGRLLGSPSALESEVTAID